MKTQSIIFSMLFAIVFSLLSIQSSVASVEHTPFSNNQSTVASASADLQDSAADQASLDCCSGASCSCAECDSCEDCSGCNQCDNSMNCCEEGASCCVAGAACCIK